MYKILNILAIVMVLIVSFCCLYDTFHYKRKVFNERNNEPSVCMVEHNKGAITYVIFISAAGEMCAVNYTADSVELEMNKKYGK